MAHSTEHSALRERLQQKEVEVTALTSLIHKQGRSLHNFSQSSVDREVQRKDALLRAHQVHARAFISRKSKWLWDTRRRRATGGPIDASI